MKEIILDLNSNASVTRVKGECRPVQDQQARAEVIAALGAVDPAVLSEQDTSLGLTGRREA